MLIVKFSEKNLIFLDDKKKKNRNINLGEYLNFKTHYFQKKFQKVLDAYIFNLKKKKNKEINKLDGNFDFSLLNDFYEKNIWKNPEIVNCLKCLALEELIKKKNTSKILLDIEDKRIYDFLKNVFFKKKIFFKNNKNNLRFDFSYKFSFFFVYIKLAIGFLIKTFSEICFKKKILSFNKSKILFITYSTIFDNDRLDDFFWKKMQLKDYNKSTKLILNADNYSNQKKINIISSLNKKKKNYEFIEAYQTFSILLKTYIKWVGLINVFNNFEHTQSQNPYLKSFLSKSIVSYSSLKNINLIYLLDRYFKYKKFKKINYLFENLTWEKGLIKILKNKVNISAYQHTSVRDWDFRYSPSSQELILLNEYLPKKIYANSLFSKKKLKNNFKKSKIYKTKKSRFSLGTKVLKLKKIRNKKILIIGDINMKETIDIVNLVSNNISNQHQLYLKLHPINKFKKLNQRNLKIINQNLNEIINNYEFIICSNSTTSIFEIIKHRKIPFVYLNKNNLNLCPLKNMSNINYISSDINIKNMISENYNKKFDFKEFKKFYV